MQQDRVSFYILLAALLSILLPASAKGALPGDDRQRIPFIVHSTAAELKHKLGVRHEFPGKFTAALTLAQAHALARTGIKTQRVRLYQLAAPPGACSPWPECKNGDGGGDGGGDTGRTATPDDQTPWGIETVYGDAAVAATTGGVGVNVAVLDSGVFKDHLDLQRRVQQCVDFSGGGPPGTVRIRSGKCDDKEGHGTHVAGTILADGGSDGQGIYGVAPGASLLAYKVCGSNGCWGDDIAAAIDYAAANGAHIVSMSLGGDSESTLISQAIARNPQLLYVAAAGNDGPDSGSMDYPAANAAVIGVGAVDSGLQVPAWSSRGVNDGDYIIEAAEVELATPGVTVASTWYDGTYYYLSGTSMATPHVSGLAAKLWQGDAASTRSYLHSLAVDIWTTGDDTATGLGLPRIP